MADFGEIQKRFDNEPELSKRFLLDPIGVLAELGVTLAPQQAFELQQTIMELKRSREASQKGIHIPPPHIPPPHLPPPSVGVQPGPNGPGVIVTL